MARRRWLAFFLSLSLLVNVFCYPRVYRRDMELNDIMDSKESLAASGTLKDAKETSNVRATVASLTVTPTHDTVDDDFDEDFDKPSTSTGGGGSNIFSLLNIANALLPSLSGTNNVKENNEFVIKLIKKVIKEYPTKLIQKRQDVQDNVIEIDYVSELTPPFYQRQKSDEFDEHDSETSETNENSSENSEDNNGGEKSIDENNGGEESIEKASNENDGSGTKKASPANASNGSQDSDDSDNDSDYDEPEGDGQGGGILGIFAGLSGGGDSDLGSLLAAIGGIIGNLSGDGVDLNAIISTGLGLFVGLLSDEGTNPGEVIASYLLTSLNTISGGGAENNGAFIGRFLSTLVKGASGGGPAIGSSEESGEGGTRMADSAGFFASLLMGILGEMSGLSSSRR